MTPPTQPFLPFAGCFATVPDAKKNSRLVFAGLPDDSQSSYRRGAHHGPDRIRQAYDGNGYNSTTESGVDLAGRVADFGDLPSQGSWQLTAQNYREFAESLFVAGKIPFFAGGDHAVTVPLVAALSVLNQRVHVVQIDAHPDLYPEFDGSRSSHACTGARILEMEHVIALTQIGVRTMNAVQAQQAERFHDRLKTFPARDWPGDLPTLRHIPRGAPVYLSVDLDGFDPAFAPGVSHPVPGGLTSRQVFNFIQTGHWRLVGMDAVEVNPDRDVNDQTAILAARVLHEGMGYAVRYDFVLPN